MKKGFTLIELLAVILLLGLLSLIVVPVVEKVISDSEDELYETQVNNIEEGAKSWAAKNVFDLPEESGKYIDITICDLEKGGFLETDVKNPKTNELFYKDSYIRITKNNYGYDYDYIEDSGYLLTCTTCMAANARNKTSAGTIPTTGNYKVSDEYKCDLGDDETRTFYVLEESGDNVSLIMDQNYDNLVTNLNETSNKLDEIRNTWTKLNSSQIGLPTFEQVSVLGDYSKSKEIYYLPSWLYINLDDYLSTDKQEGYWTSTPTTDSAWYVTIFAYGSPTNGVKFEGILQGSDSSSYDLGVRPVITIPKTELSN